MNAREHYDYLKDRIADVRKVSALGTFVTFTGICPIIERLSWLYKYRKINACNGKIKGEDFKDFVNDVLSQTNVKYQNTSGCDIYEHLRCAVLHCLSLHNSVNDSNSKFILAHRHDKEIDEGIIGHLDTYKGKVVLVAEDLLDELEKALTILWKDQNINSNFLTCANSVPPIGHEFYEKVSEVNACNVPNVSGMPG